jgi:hypothetical protein
MVDAACIHIEPRDTSCVVDVRGLAVQGAWRQEAGQVGERRTGAVVDECPLKRSASGVRRGVSGGLVQSVVAKQLIEACSGRDDACEYANTVPIKTEIATTGVDKESDSVARGVHTDHLRLKTAREVLTDECARLGEHEALIGAGSVVPDNLSGAPLAWATTPRRCGARPPWVSEMRRKIIFLDQMNLFAIGTTPCAKAV